jgi:enamine deaminase RidA (YjgF/YER057c/UK114 family)
MSTSAVRTALNPASLPRNPAFSQGVAVDGPGRTIYVGGQNGVAAPGPGREEAPDVASQTTAALANLAAVLAEGGATLSDVVSWSVLVVADADLGAAFGAFQRAWGGGEPPAITVARVSGLANPRFLVEISAVAVVAA